MRWNWERIAAVVGHHHERWDGRGYPRGRQEEAIPLLARIVSGPTSSTPGPHGEAVRILRESAGTYLDPALVRLFLEQRLYERAPQRLARA
ncbi:MAG: hypothetical protein HYY05_07610 [Chloroflexi bacterium]|nr:hypothetical protein [Chloroflexota bacterium]